MSFTSRGWTNPTDEIQNELVDEVNWIVHKRRQAEVKYMKKRVKRQKDNFYEEIDDEDAFVPDIAIYKNKNVDKKDPYVKNGNLFVSSGFVDDRNGKQGVKKKVKCVLM